MFFTRLPGNKKLQQTKRLTNNKQLLLLQYITRYSVLLLHVGCRLHVDKQTIKLTYLTFLLNKHSGKFIDHCVCSMIVIVLIAVYVIFYFFF